VAGDFPELRDVRGQVNRFRVFTRSYRKAPDDRRVIAQSHNLVLGPGPAADLNTDGTVDLKDFALLADMWLDDQTWPQR